MGQRIDKIKLHFKEHKREYLIGAACLVVGIITGAEASRKGNMVQVSEKFNVKYKSPTETNIDIMIEAPKRRMHPGYLVQHDQTGVTYPSVRYASRQLGLNAHEVYNHLKDGSSDVKGQTFTVLGDARA